MDPMLLIQSAWINEEADYVPKQTFTAVKTKTLKKDVTRKLDVVDESQVVNDSNIVLISPTDEVKQEIIKE